MTRTVKDNALMLEAIAGNDNIDDRSFAAPYPSTLPKYSHILASLPDPSDLSGLRIGIIEQSLSGAVLDPRVLETFLRSAYHFRSLGATVDEVSIPFHKKGPAIWTGISKIGGYLSKTSGAFGRRGHQMVELNKLFHPMQQSNWDNGYVSTKNVYLNGVYAGEHFPHLLAKTTNLSR